MSAVGVTREVLSTELEKRVPRVLAQATKRPIGAPGLATYTVTRGTLSTSVKRGSLFVSTKVSTDIEICKPFGPMCVRYGSCAPRFDTTFEVPLGLEQDFSWRRPHSVVRVERGCKVVVVDVTHQLLGMAQREAVKTELRIRKQLPELRPEIERLWKLLHTPLFLDAQQCLRVTPSQLFQRPATEVSDGYGVSAGLTARVELTEDCSSRTKAPALPNLEQQPEGPASSMLRVAALIDKSTVEQQLRRQLSDLPLGGPTVSDIQIRFSRPEALPGSKPDAVLDIGVVLGGTACGTLWLRTRPEFNEDGAVTLQIISLPLTQGSSSPEARARVTKLAATLRPQLVIAPPAPWTDLKGRFEQWLALAEALLDEAQAGDNARLGLGGLSLKMEHTVDHKGAPEALVTSDGIQIVAPFEADIKLLLH